MRKIILLLIAIIISSNALADDYSDLKHSKTINELFEKYNTTKDPQKKQFYLVTAAEQHSGLANYLLAQQVNIPDLQKIKYYLQSVKYGYPKLGYQGIAKIYQQGLGVAKDDFKSQCYANLAKENPNMSLIEACRSRYPNSIDDIKNLGLQSSYEIKRQADADYKLLCENDSSNYIVNPNIDTYVRNILIEKICNKKSPQNKKLKITKGDLIYQNNKILEKTDKGYIPYNKQISDGLVVYRPNPPYSLYIAKKGELIPAKDGDEVIKDSHTYIVQDNRLVKYQP